MNPGRMAFSTKKAYVSCIIGLALTESLLYAISKTLFLDPLSARPDIFLAVAIFAVALALVIRWLSAKFSFAHTAGGITVWSPLPWARKREIGTANASAEVKADIIDRLLGTASVEICGGGRKQLFGPLDMHEADALEKSINRKK